MDNDEQKEVRFSYRDVFGGEEGPCAQTETVFLYAQGLLSGRAKDQWERHLKGCARCARQLADYLEAEKLAESTALEESAAQSLLDRQHERLQSYLEEKYGRSPARPIRRTGFFARYFGRSPLPALANIALAALVLILIVPAYRSARLSQQLTQAHNQLAEARSQSQAQSAAQAAERQRWEEQARALEASRRALAAPQLSGAGVRSIRPERSGRTEAIEVTFSDRQPTFNLLLSMPAPESATYVVEIAQNHSVLWRAEMQPSRDPRTPAALLSLTLHRDFFKLGDYQLAVYSRTSGKTTLLDTYALRIRGTAVNDRR